MKARECLLGILAISLLQGCGIANRNRTFSEFRTSNPATVAVLVDYKSILERPASYHQLSSQSTYPDTADRGSAWAYRRNSSEAELITASDVGIVVMRVLSSKGYECVLVEGNSIGRPDSIAVLIRAGRNTWAAGNDAILFIDFSDMFSRIFARIGVAGNPGHALYLRYALFESREGRILSRAEITVHPDFYFTANYTPSEMQNDLLELLEKKLAKEFPNRLSVNLRP
jgi:hypothetical protein